MLSIEPSLRAAQHQDLWKNVDGTQREISATSAESPYATWSELNKERYGAQYLQCPVRGKPLPSNSRNRHLQHTVRTYLGKKKTLQGLAHSPATYLIMFLEKNKMSIPDAI